MKCPKCGREMKEPTVLRSGLRFLVASQCPDTVCLWTGGGEVLLSPEMETFEEAEKVLNMIRDSI